MNGYLRLPLSTPFPRDPLSTARRQHDALVDLARRPSLHAGRLPVALREIAEKAAETLDVERIGIWFFTPDCRAIRCTELFERTPAVHSDGGELTALRYPVYFKALESERTINASDARLDPRTSAFKEAYRDPKWSCTRAARWAWRLSCAGTGRAMGSCSRPRSSGSPRRRA